MSSKALINTVFAVVAATLSMGSHCLELGLDASFNSSTQVDDWGVASHLQLIGESGFGLDVGYQRYNSITYNALNTSLTHSMDQFEIGTLWQAGDEAFRFQALAGGVLSNSWVQSAGNDVVRQYAPGYQIGAGGERSCVHARSCFCGSGLPRLAARRDSKPFSLALRRTICVWW